MTDVLDNNPKTRIFAAVTGLFILSLSIDAGVAAAVLSFGLDPTTAGAFGVQVVAYLLLATLGGAYLWYRDIGLEYVDLYTPTWSTWIYGIGGGILSLVLNFGIGFLTQPFGGEFLTSSESVQIFEVNIWYFAAFALIQLVVGAPVKALFFLNVIQKQLYPAFSRLQAVLLGGTLFFTLTNTIAKLPQLLNGDIIAGSVLVITLFIHSLIFAFVYERTDDLIAAAATNFTYVIIPIIASVFII